MRVCFYYLGFFFCDILTSSLACTSKDKNYWNSTNNCYRNSLSLFNTTISISAMTISSIYSLIFSRVYFTRKISLKKWGCNFDNKGEVVLAARFILLAIFRNFYYNQLGTLILLMLFLSSASFLYYSLTNGFQNQSYKFYCSGLRFSSLWACFYLTLKYYSWGFFKEQTMAFFFPLLFIPMIFVIKNRINKKVYLEIERSSIHHADENLSKNSTLFRLRNLSKIALEISLSHSNKIFDSKSLKNLLFVHRAECFNPNCILKKHEEKDSEEEISNFLNYVSSSYIESIYK